MVRRHFPQASFAVNRWDVGCQAPPSADAEAVAEKNRQRLERETIRLRATRAKAKIRPRLWQQNPHCVHCHRLMQIGDSSLPTYACVVGDRLACRDCVAVVQSFIDAERCTLSTGEAR